MSYYGPDGPSQASDPWQRFAAGNDSIEPGYPAGFPEGGPPEQRPAPSKALLAVLVSVLVVVLCGGGVGFLYLLGGHGGQPPPGATGKATPSLSPSHSPSFDPNSIIRGQCLANTGTKASPQLVPASCDHGHFKVMERVDATGDETVCKAVAGATNAYYYRTTPEKLSFVLCLQAL
jgi:hypothetical protein